MLYRIIKKFGVLIDTNLTSLINLSEIGEVKTSYLKKESLLVSKYRHQKKIKKIQSKLKEV